MRRKTAKEILAESLHELADEKGIDKITIKEIVDNCGYSPATFYRNFRDKYDLIAWEYTRGLAQIMDRICDGGYAWRQTLLDGAHCFQTERKYLANLFRHTSGHESFMRYMLEINYSALKNYILNVCGKSELDKKEDLCIRIYCLGTVSLTCEWILEKYDASPEEIADVCESSLPEPLRKYLL